MRKKREFYIKWKTDISDTHALPQDRWVGAMDDIITRPDPSREKTICIGRHFHSDDSGRSSQVGRDGFYRI